MDILQERTDQMSDLQERARAAGVTLRATPPQPTTCCGRGCNGCVWEGYYFAVDTWCEDANLLLNL
jgi:Oxidoreductase-like protein, N-terminal